MSTVHICLKDIVGAAVKSDVIFYSGDAPYRMGSALVAPGLCSVRLGEDGTGSVELVAGRYSVFLGGHAENTVALEIYVPDDEAAYELTDLITAGTKVLPLRDFLEKADNLSDVADAATAFGNIKQAATSAATGVVQLATQTEVDAGTDAAKALTPATFANSTAFTNIGTEIVTIQSALDEKASSSDLLSKADTGVVLLQADNLSDVSDAAAAFGNIKQAATTTSAGVVQLATEDDVTNGSSATVMTPAAFNSSLQGSNLTVLTNYAAWLNANNAFQGTNNTAPNQVGVTPVDATLLAKAQADALYPVVYKYVLATALTATSITDVVDTGITVPAGTYRFTAAFSASTASTTSGGNVYISSSAGSYAGESMVITPYWYGTNENPSTPYCRKFRPNNGSSLDGSISISLLPIGQTYLNGIATGILKFHSQSTVYFHITQTVTDASNALTLIAGSNFTLTKIP